MGGISDTFSRAVLFIVTDPILGHGAWTCLRKIDRQIDE